MNKNCLRLIWVLIVAWIALPVTLAQGLQETGLNLTFVRTLGVTSNNNRTWDVEWSFDGNYLASAYQDGAKYLWDLETGTVITSFNCGYYHFPTRTLEWSSDEATLAVGCSGIGSFLEITSFENQLAIIKFDNDDQAIGWSPDGNQLAVPLSDGRIGMFDANSLKVLYSLGESVQPPTGQTTDVGIPWAVDFEWSQDGEYLAVISQAQASGFKIWHLETRQTIFNSGRNYFDIAWLKEGNIFASSGSKGRVDALSIWDTATMEMLTMLSGSADTVEASPDGSYLAYCDGEQLHIISADTLLEVPLYHTNGFGQGISCHSHDIAWSSNSMLALAETDGTVNIWQVSNPR